MSFNAKTGEKESAQPLWSNSVIGRMQRSRGLSIDAPLQFAPRIPGQSVDGDKGGIVIVDPFSTGAHLAATAASMGYKVVRMLSIWDSPVATLVEQGLQVDYCATLQFNDLNPDQEAALNEVRKY
jgi:hypothetical protein